MPPRGRKRQRVESESESEPEPEPRQSFTSPDPSSPEVLEQEEARPPFYNTTFSTHRVSPLYVGKQPLNRQRLQTLSQRLREILVGDVVRGVEVGLGRADGEDGVMGRAGALEYVDIRWVSMGTVLDITSSDQHESDEDDEDTTRTDLDWSALVEQLQDKKALHILLRYEAAECTALLLPSSSDQQPETSTTQFVLSNSQPTSPPNPTHFLSLPLLLLRMPVPLKTIMADFLSTTFDCRVSSLRLGTRSLVQSWESWIRTAGLAERGPLAKDMVLNLGFYIPPLDKGNTHKENAPDATAAAGEDKERSGQEPLGIKGVDVIIPAAELGRFVRAGKQLDGDKAKEKEKGNSKEKPTWETDVKKRRKLAGRLGEEGWEWRTIVSGDNETEEGQQQSPFTEALGRYVDKHLGLNLFHPGVRVTKIACGGFVMSEGRLKVFAPREGGQRQKAAVWKLVSGLVGKAEGGKALM
ncbi:hypothetical protein N0V85_006341 [Neurospora sp. IMI 360204]|nr:hypothetical protein N0V85_006341 [Neurospora sp. IMI 360204]